MVELVLDQDHFKMEQEVEEQVVQDQVERILQEDLVLLILQYGEHPLKLGIQQINLVMGLLQQGFFQVGGDQEQIVEIHQRQVVVDQEEVEKEVDQDKELLEIMEQQILAEVEEDLLVVMEQVVKVDQVLF
jgi:hypothetical protein